MAQRPEQAAFRGKNGGRLRGLAASTLKRSAALPDLPAVTEVLPGFEVNTWFGI